MPLSNPPEADYISRSNLSTKLGTLTQTRLYRDSKNKRSNNRAFTAVTQDMETFCWSINELCLNCEKIQYTCVFLLLQKKWLYRLGFTDLPKL